MIRSGKVEAGTDSSTWRETVLWCSHCSVIHGTRLISHGVGARGWAMQRLIGVFRSAGVVCERDGFCCLEVTVRFGHATCESRPRAWLLGVLL